MMYNCSVTKQLTHSNKVVSVANSIHYSSYIYNYFKTYNLGLFIYDMYLNYLVTIILSFFLRRYRGKMIDFQQVSHCRGDHYGLLACVFLRYVRFVTGMEIKDICDFMNRNIGLLLNNQDG